MWKDEIPLCFYCSPVVSKHLEQFKTAAMAHPSQSSHHHIITSSSSGNRPLQAGKCRFRVPEGWSKRCIWSTVGAWWTRICVSCLLDTMQQLVVNLALGNLACFSHYWLHLTGWAGGMLEATEICGIAKPTASSKPIGPELSGADMFCYMFASLLIPVNPDFLTGLAGRRSVILRFWMSTSHKSLKIFRRQLCPLTRALQSFDNLRIYMLSHTLRIGTWEFWQGKTQCARWRHSCA